MYALFNFHDDLISGGLRNLENMFNSLNETMKSIGNVEVGGLSDLLPNGVFDQVKSIAMTTILPFGILLLVIFLVIELTEKLSDMNVFSDNTLSHILSFFFKLFLGIFILYNSFNIVDMTFGVANEVVKLSSTKIEQDNVQETDFDLYNFMEKSLREEGVEINYEKGFLESVKDSVINFFSTEEVNYMNISKLMKEEGLSYNEAFLKELENVKERNDLNLIEKEELRRKSVIVNYYFKNVGSGEALSFWAVSFVISLVSYFIPLVITLVLSARAIELYLHLAISPLPLSMLFSRQMSNSGLNFLKNIFSYGIQALVIIFILYIYQRMQIANYNMIIQNPSNVELYPMALSMLGYGLLACIMLFQSKTLALRLLGGH